MNEPWLRLAAVTCAADPPPPIVMPRWFRRHRPAEGEVLVEGLDLDAGAGITVLVGPPKATHALLAVAMGVRQPVDGTATSSSRVVGVLRRRARLLVDMRLRRAAVREARLRGLPARLAGSVGDDVAILTGLDPDRWTSTLDREEYLRIAPAVAAASGAPIVVLDGVITGRSEAFEARLLRRILARAEERLLTVIAVPHVGLVGPLLDSSVDVAVVDLEPWLAVGVDRRGTGGDQDADDDLDLDDDDDGAADDDDLEVAAGDAVAAVAPDTRTSLPVEVRAVIAVQDGARTKAIDGSRPSAIELEIETGVPGPARWELRLVDSGTGTVLAAAETDGPAPDGPSRLRLDLPAGMPRGLHEVHLRHEVALDGAFHVTSGPPVGHIIFRGDVRQVPRRSVIEALEWVP